MQLNEQTRQRLIDACAEDLENTLRSDSPGRLEIARDGFKGYSNMTDADLVESFRDAGLDEVYVELAEKVGVVPEES